MAHKVALEEIVYWDTKRISQPKTFLEVFDSRDLPLLCLVGLGAKMIHTNLEELSEDVEDPKKTLDYRSFFAPTSQLFPEKSAEVEKHN